MEQSCREDCLVPSPIFLSTKLMLSTYRQHALETVGFSAQDQFALFRIIAAILHLGQLSLAVSGTSSAHLSSRSSLEKVAFLLGVSPDDLHNALVRPKIKAANEWVTQSRTRDQVVDELAALSKSLYEKNFGKLVDRINESLSGVGLGDAAQGGGGSARKHAFIGVLDIAGFEIFETNGFEQLCINLTNEVSTLAFVEVPSIPRVLTDTVSRLIS